MLKKLIINQLTKIEWIGNRACHMQALGTNFKGGWNKKLDSFMGKHHFQTLPKIKIIK